MGLVDLGALHPLDPDEHADDHQLVARLLLLLRPDDVRAAVRPGHYHASQATAELVLALLVVGAMIGTLVSGRITDAMLRRGFLEAGSGSRRSATSAPPLLLIPGFLGRPPDAGGVVRRRRRRAAVGRQPAARCRPARHHARRPVGPRREHRTVAALARPGAGAARVRRPRDLIAGIVPQQAPIGTHARRRLRERRARSRDQLPDLARTLVAAGLFLLRARVTYPSDVATAAASHQASTGDQPPRPPKMANEPRVGSSS